MSLKLRSGLLFTGLSLLLLLGTLGYVYAAHSRSRQQEFYARLEAQCIRVATLLDEVRTADRHLLRVIDLNTIHRIHDEKVLLFNEEDILIYSSLDDEPIPYSSALLARIRAEGRIAHHDADGDEVVGVHYTDNNSDLVVLASAFDTYGQRELENLARTLSISAVLGLLFIFGTAYFYIGVVLRPVVKLREAVAGLDIDRLDKRLPTGRGKDELDALAVEFNAMLERLRAAFALQRSFVDNASHELRTPLARMNALLEEASSVQEHDHARMRDLLGELQNEIADQADLMESLLLLERLKAQLPAQRSPVRVDEVLFAAVDATRAAHAPWQASVDIDPSITGSEQLTVSINPILLRTAFRNLLTNAALHGSGAHSDIRISHHAGQLTIRISNPGSDALDAERIFEPFFRSTGSEHVRGSGLGLSIVERILEDAGGSIVYSYADGQHHFRSTLPSVG